MWNYYKESQYILYTYNCFFHKKIVFTERRPLYKKPLYVLEHASRLSISPDFCIFDIRMGTITELKELRNRSRVFEDRRDAGRRLAELLSQDMCSIPGPIVLAVLSGGVPVGVELAGSLCIRIDGIPVSKITFPWNTESGFGACAFDGTIVLNPRAVEQSGLRPKEREECVAKARDKVRRRMELLYGGRDFPALAGRVVVIVDDGLASGCTARAAIASVKKKGAESTIVASPTGSLETVRSLSGECDRVYCANVRDTMRFAVADAYARWYDEDEALAIEMLISARAHEC
jgi:putative phosphoribosyl transferase